MTALCILTAVVQLALLGVLAVTGRRLSDRAAADLRAMRAMPEESFPAVALVIPVAGTHPLMADALKSLICQDYPKLTSILVTATDTEAAALLADELQREFPSARHAVAGQAQNSGQKNHNSLCGVRAAGDSAEILVFCDSTHPAKPDFVRALVAPIIRGEAEFTTGYHQVLPRDARPVTLAYALCVMLMRFLQALAPFTQPWGGAMAARRSAFTRYDIAGLWADNVVDDCSLAGVLPGLGAHVRLCPGSLLNTEAAAHRLPVWRAWMDRQVLFLKFCVPGQWLLLGLLCLVMAAPLCWAGLTLGAALPQLSFGATAWAALLYCGLLTIILNLWRRLLPVAVPLPLWLPAFVCSAVMFVYVYARSLTAKGILWHGIDYTVGRGGKVLAMRRR